MLLVSFKYGKLLFNFVETVPLNSTRGGSSCLRVLRSSFVAMEACKYAMRRDCIGYTVQCAYVKLNKRS